MPSGMSIVTYAWPAISASVRPLSGRALDGELAVGELDVLGRRLEVVRGDLLGLVDHLHGRAGDRLAADGQRARAVGAEARTGPVPVSPWTTSTMSGVIPSRSATICANEVSSPWPCGAVPE